ncbi:hypothetical protein NQ314_007003 [Rhamnusium bicolor]|uniref:EB domain-containing protein n=1 Tax=Rhamnusium bicolor TaxID=1586634 RepID=A0AAV8YV93_9CUCU|nr:hypothetical protein NQ314_007003 [Rhamnusium bicolor]
MLNCVLLFFLLNVLKVYSQLSANDEQRLVSYQRCLLDIHCQRVNENSFCFGNDDTKTGVYAGWDEPCEKNVQCYYLLSTNAICDTNCKCAEGAHRYVDGRCYTSIRKSYILGLGDFCQTSGNCLLKDGSFGNCVDGRCECKFDKQLPTEDAMSCVEAKDLGEICESDEQCSFIPNAVCRVSCRCAPGFALSRNGKSCLRAATTFFEPCEESVQCSEFLQGSFCNNGNCTCLEYHHGFGSRCVRSAGLGETCIGMENCIPDPKFSEIANCLEGTCQCLPGAVDENIGCNSYKVYYNMTIVNFCILYLLFNYF